MICIEARGVCVDIPVHAGGSDSLKAEIARFAKRTGRINIQDASYPTVRALTDITLAVRDGDRIGIVGRNGSGKTTLIRVLSGIFEPTAGTIRIAGRPCALLDLTLGLDMEASGWENIYLRGYALGLSRRQIRALEAEIADFTELGEYLALPMRTYSAGMTLRLAFAVSTAAPHEILLLDEAIGTGDAAFLAKARARLLETVSRSRVLVVASHNLELLANTCTGGIYLQEGRIVTTGPIADVIEHYLADTIGVVKKKKKATAEEATASTPAPELRQQA